MPDQGKLVADSMTVQRVPGTTVVGDNVEFTVTVNAQYTVPIDPADVRAVAAGRHPRRDSRFAAALVVGTPP